MMSLPRILCREYLPQMIWPVLGMAGLALRFIWPAADLLGSMIFFLCCVAAGLSAGRQAERRTEPEHRRAVTASPRRIWAVACAGPALLLLLVLLLFGLARGSDSSSSRIFGEPWILLVAVVVLVVMAVARGLRDLRVHRWRRGLPSGDPDALPPSSRNAGTDVAGKQVRA